MFFFFFKQKTAYEMRISDWSSDVCSSDLVRVDFILIGKGTDAQQAVLRLENDLYVGGHIIGDQRRNADAQVHIKAVLQLAGGAGRHFLTCPGHQAFSSVRGRVVRPGSDEHTSELQSLMRISYAVFCL